MEKEFNQQSFDGLNLRGRTDVPDRPKAIVVIVHGLCEHLGRYDYLTKRLEGKDYAVYRFDHRGHGRSEGKQTFYKDFGEIIEDTKTIVDKAKAENHGKKVFLIGHSMGGYAVALFGTKYPGQVSGIITSGALTRYNLPIFGSLPLAQPADTYTPNGLADGVCSDPSVIEAYVNDPLVAKQVSFGLINTMHDGVEWLKANAKSFADSVLVMHGAFDGLVAEKDSRDFFGDISSKDKTLKIWSSLMHEIFNEKAKDEVIDEVLRWLDKRA
jgi:lysophospholipase